MAAERDRRFYTGKSSGNKGATLAALKHQTDQREALGCNVEGGLWGGFLVFGLGPIKKKKRTTDCFALILYLLFVGPHMPGMEVCLSGKINSIPIH